MPGTLPVTTITQPDWGVSFPRTPGGSETLTVHSLALPDELHVPLHQHSGVAAVPLVQPGDTVLRGQPIGAVPQGALGARVHAPTSGTVTAVEADPASGRHHSLRVSIAADGKDTRWNGYPAYREPLRLPTAELRRAVIEGGIVGLGGATFPAGIKLNRGSGVTTLIINAAECEPVIRCDDALLQSEAIHVLRGAQIMLRILEAERCIIAIKSSMAMARAALEAAHEQLQDDRFSLALVPPVYPVGGESQLIQLLTGQEIPAGGLPWDSGAICQNVGTAVAVARMLYEGEPLIRRVVTVTGGGICESANYDVRLGTPVSILLHAAGGCAPGAGTLVMGGPMMGVKLPSADVPVTKACNCIYVPGPDALQEITAEQPCIRCGECARVCPASLTPQLLLQSQRNSDLDRLVDLGLSACIECGCCDYVCPSHIPLTQSFVSAKRALWQRAAEERRARNAEQRIAARAARQAAASAQRTSELEALDAPVEHDPQQALQELLQRTGKAQEPGDKPEGDNTDKPGGGAA